jgi:predicted nucleic acid-binding Zn ribbon protein
MALVACPECGAQISDKATTCPQCGHPMLTAGRRAWQPFGVGWMAICVLALIVALFALLGTCNWVHV